MICQYLVANFLIVGTKICQSFNFRYFGSDSLGAPTTAIVIMGVIFYIAIRSGRLMIWILIPCFIYLITIVITTIALSAVISVILLYYYKLIFDQLNDEFESIVHRSFDSVSSMDQMRLILMVKRHDQRANQLNLVNLMTRRSIALFWVSIALLQVIPLNIYLEEQLLFYKFFYFLYILGVIGFGFGVSVLFSWQIKSAHRPAKSCYKILTRNLHKQQFGFHFKWKVK